MEWREFMRTIVDIGECPKCGMKLRGLFKRHVKAHFINEHPEEMLDLFTSLRKRPHYCPFHRGGRHQVFVTCDQPVCPECGNNLENWRIRWVAGWLAATTK